MAGFGDTIRSAWSGRPGRKWLVVGGLGAAGYLWWTRRHGGASGGASGSGDVSLTPGGAAVGEPATPPGGDYSQTPTPTPRPTSNAEWLAEAVAKLILPPYNFGSVATWNSLQKALAGQPLTSGEAAIVEAALTAVGTPPEGMPQLNISAPSGGGGGTGGGSQVTHTVHSGETLTGIAAAWHETGSRVYARNAGAIEAAARNHGRSSSRGGPNNTPGWWIYPGTVLYKP